MNKFLFSILVGLMLLFMISETTVSTCFADVPGPDGVYRGPAWNPDWGPEPKHRKERKIKKVVKKQDNTLFVFAGVSVLFIVLGSLYGLYRIRPTSDNPPISKDETHD